MKKVVVLLLSLLILTSPVLAEETRTSGPWEYILTDKGAVLTNWIYYADSYVLPDAVEIPAGVEMVQRWAFSGCGSEVEVITTSDATHFETAAEYEARTGYRHWMDGWAEE